MTSNGHLGTVASIAGSSTVKLDNVNIKTPITVKDSTETRVAAAIGGASGNAVITLSNVVASCNINAKFSLYGATLVGNVLDSNVTINGKIRSDVSG